MIGDQESFGFLDRSLREGGLNFEDDTPETLAEAIVFRDSDLTK